MFCLNSFLGDLLVYLSYVNMEMTAQIENRKTVVSKNNAHNRRHITMRITNNT